ncbi:putative quinol monooxygenase [Roseimicrobium sp. ORNL1]|uniref:putative quinol monooxygenase n=1 Tax=Roseimicrobium sp. ORNL1 TaxID=2711231 RepID=UPI0013E1B1C8|nr:putative quinol monooxygenase [Roseimicrobium sp. ORNL1]QIF02265.1 antibiotic biosynthesis monooxygenase [Roseimicrobium sp. ORNL1]
MEREVIAIWKVRASETERVLGLLPALAAQTRGEEGNIFYSVYRSETDPNEFILHECYADEHAADAHRKSDHYQNIVVAEIIPHLESRTVTVVKKLL